MFLLGLMAVLRKMGKTNPAAEPGFWQNKKVLLRGGIFCGVALFAASAAQQMGIGTTSTAKAGFMTALYVVLVPVAGVFLGSRPGVKLWGCVAASVVGLYLLCLAGRDTLSLTGGEWQLLVCAILFTAQIMLVNHFSPQLDGIQLSFVQFFVVSVLSTIFAFVFEAPSPDHCQSGDVSRECVQRPGRLADPGRDALCHRAVRLRADVRRDCGESAAGETAEGLTVVPREVVLSFGSKRKNQRKLPLFRRSGPAT